MRVKASIGAVMNDDRLTETLAAAAFGWKAAPDRFIKPGRSWIPKWRFRPLECLEDAMGVLDRVATGYRLELCEGGVFKAEVRVGSQVGKAAGEPKARTITLAVVAALGEKRQ